MMIYNMKKNLYQSLKSITYSTLLRKKKISFSKKKNIKQLNIKLKLQFMNYHLFSFLVKSISIYNNFKNKGKFIFF